MSGTVVVMGAHLARYRPPVERALAKLKASWQGRAFRSAFPPKVETPVLCVRNALQLSSGALSGRLTPYPLRAFSGKKACPRA